MKTPLEILHKYFHHFKSERTRDLVVRAMEDYAKIYHETEVKKLQQHDVSGKQQIQWQAIESYLNHFGTGHKGFKELLFKQARGWFEREFVVMVELPDNHVCRYSKAMNQPYPRLCVDCGKPEGN